MWGDRDRKTYLAEKRKMKTKPLNQSVITSNPLKNVPVSAQRKSPLCPGDRPPRDHAGKALNCPMSPGPSRPVWARPGPAGPSFGSPGPVWPSRRGAVGVEYPGAQALGARTRTRSRRPRPALGFVFTGAWRAIYSRVTKGRTPVCRRVGPKAPTREE